MPSCRPCWTGAASRLHRRDDHRPERTEVGIRVSGLEMRGSPPGPRIENCTSRASDRMQSRHRRFGHH
jgi:hypothetical protein